MYDLLADSTIVNVYQNGTPREIANQPQLIGYITQFMGQQKAPRQSDLAVSTERIRWTPDARSA